MKTWDIKVLNFGKISIRMSFMWPQGMPPLAEDFDADGPYLGYLLQSKGENILVDTGITDSFIVDGKAWGMLPAEGGKKFVEKALAKEGLGPDDIQTVLCTHLHNDHAGNCTLFKKAKIVFQRDEWENLLNPLPSQNLRKDYDPGVIAELQSMPTLKVDGDFDIADGVKIYKTPGHTRGSQSSAVNTKKGVVVIIGDLCLANFLIFPSLGEFMDSKGVMRSIPKAPPVYSQVIPTMMVYDHYAFYDSVYKVKAIASRDEPGYILPGHEPSLLVTGV
jgi:N-acyl homoserine lactone hydrolase